MSGVRLSLLNYFKPPHKNSFRSLTPEELKRIKDFASSMEVPVISPHYMDFSNINPDNSSQIYETEILIRKDGSLVLQDITSDVLKSIKSLTIK
jgi:predicted metallo-beta-lactamase superfamily hydrolase